jgi:hypothetical protein
MDEFRNRMSAQREILSIVNKFSWRSEKLCGLSENAIVRWSTANRLEAKSEVVVLVRKAARLLFFLATKSQEQVTDEYRARMCEVIRVIEELRLLFKNATQQTCGSA